MMENTVTIADHVESYVVQLEENAKTGVLVAYDNELIGVIGVADPLKREAAVVIEGLMKMGVNPVMVTGDNWRTAKAVAKEVNISSPFSSFSTSINNFFIYMYMVLASLMTFL